MPDTTMPLAPMAPHAAISAFNRLRAVQAGDVDAARESPAPSRGCPSRSST
jgi:hypothetical protein